MARLNKKAELFSHLTQMAVYRDQPTTPGNTTLNTAAAPGNLTLTVAAITNFANGDLLRIGSGENVEVHTINGAPAGNTITLRDAVLFAHPVGEVVKEQILTDLGHITDNGFKFNFTGNDQAVQSAVRRLVLGYILGHVEGMFDVELEGFNLENIATALGMPEGNISGAGTSVSPSSLSLDPANFRSENDLCFQAIGVRKDAQIVTVQMLGVEVDIAALSSALTRGNPALIPLRGRVTSGVRVLLNT